MATRSNNKRDHILDAALRVVERKGANHLTMDAVAAEAGFSKGGVLYHFESKKALLAGMLDRLIEANRRRIDERAGRERPLAALLHFGDRMTRGERRASLALLAAAAEDPKLLAPARQHLKGIFSRVSSAGRDSIDSQILFLAKEGLRFLDILELNPMSKQQSSRMIKRLQKLAEEG